MPRRWVLLPSLVTLIAMLTAGLVPLAGASPGGRAETRVEGRYIVVLKPEATGASRTGGRPEGGQVRAAVREVGRANGVGVTHVYEAVLGGFAAEIPSETALRQLARDPRVASIEPDRLLEAAADDLPLGVDRVGADVAGEGVPPAQPTRSGSPIAVLDTGIAAAHDDLAGVVKGGFDCTKPEGEGNTFGTDVEGHGTRVAGTISALNNGFGVVGVAPGTPLYDVKVLDDARVGRSSWTICGLDWVTKNAAATGVRVVNMSLVGEAIAADHNPCGPATSALHNAVCGVREAGLTLAAAAGNSGIDANGIAPATYREVTTVSALVDTDGCAGGRGRTATAGADDTRANFSNTGADLDVAAPGARVVSTAPGDGYDRRSGTSMATPHVAAAYALGWTGAEETNRRVPEGILKLSPNTGC